MGSSIDFPSTRRKSKKISFKDEVVTHWLEKTDKRKRSSSLSEDDPHTISPPLLDIVGHVEECMGDAEGDYGGEVRNKSIADFKNRIKSKVGSMLKRSSRIEVQDNCSELESSDSFLSFNRNGRYKRKDRDSRSLFTESHESVLASSKPSLPRAASLDSSDLFTSNNKSFKAKIRRLGRSLRHESLDEGDPVVLTKVTPLGGSNIGSSLWTYIE